MNNDDFCAQLCAALGVSLRADAAQLNPLALAYVGDTVYDLAVRTYLVQGHDAKAHALHVASSARVRASAQAAAAKVVLGRLDDVELSVFRRARNAKPGSIPKNAKPEDYAAATGLEALFGYLFLTGQQERMLELLRYALASQKDDFGPGARPYKTGRS